MSSYPYLPAFEDQFDVDRQQEFVIGRMLGRVHTAMLVRVLAVRPTTGKVGFVDVLPLVQEVDTARKVIAQSPIYNVPFVRYQGGPSAVVLDPAVGDIGITTFAERDITSVKATVGQGPAATDRRHDIADGLYIGGVLNPEPTQYVRFQPMAGGIEIHSPAYIELTTPGHITLDAGGNVLIKSATRIDLQAPIIQNTATTSFGATAPAIAFFGNMTWFGYTGGAGTVTMSNMNWSVAGGSMNFNGVATTYTGGTFTYNGKNMTNTHTHGGVQTGGGTTGGVS